MVTPAATVLLWCLLCPSAAEAQEADVTLHRAEESVLLDITLQGYDGDAVLEALGENMRSRVVYIVRLYRSGSILGGILGDRLVEEYRVSYDAEWDMFERTYTIEVAADVPTARRVSDDVSAAGGRTPGPGDVRRQTGRRTFSAREEFLRNLFTVRNMALPRSVFDREHRWYVLVQVRVTPARLVPALGILSFFMNEHVVETPWKQVVIAPASEGPS